MPNESDNLFRDLLTTTLTAEVNLYQMPPWVGYLEIGFLVIIMLIGVPGNFLIICVQFRNRDKSSTDYMILMMAGYELVCSSINAIFKIVMNLKIWREFASDTLCRLHLNMIYVTTFTSAFLLAGIALDRYVKTCKPLSNICTVKTSKLACVVIGVLGYITGISGYYNAEVDQSYVCNVAPRYLKQQFIWDMCLVASTTVIFVIFVFAYSSIAITLRQRMRTRKQARKLIKVSSTTGQQSGQCSSSVLQKLRRTRVEPLVDVEQSASGSSGTIILSRQPSEREVSQQDTSFSNYRVLEEKPKQYLSVVTTKHPATLAEETVNRTTLMLFILTVIYAVTFTIANIFVLTADSVIGPIMVKLGKPLLMFNCITNPVCFFCMSSKYRASAKRLLFRHRQTQ